MKLVLVNSNGQFDVSTDIVSVNNKPKYHNIKFGSKTSGLWRLSFGVDKRIANVIDDPMSVSLTDDDYILNPVINMDGIQRTDKRGNGIFYISKDSKANESERSSILALIEIPNNFYRNVTIKLSGSCMNIGTGFNGHNINNVIYSSPYPVVLIKKDMELIWTGLDKDGKTVTQTITYGTNGWYTSEILTKQS